MKKGTVLVLAGIFACILMNTALAAEKPSGQADPKRSYGAVDVILYQTSWCPYCTKARDYLQDSGVSLVVYDIEKRAVPAVRDADEERSVWRAGR